MKKDMEKKVKILEKYEDDMTGQWPLYVKGGMPSKSIDNALKKVNNVTDRKNIIGLCDTSLMNNGKSGILFTDTKIIFFETAAKPWKLWYDDVESVSYSVNGEWNEFKIHLIDGKNILWSSLFMDGEKFISFLKDMKESEQEMLDSSMMFIENGEVEIGAEASGLAVANYNEVNKLYEEEKFGAHQGHGFAAEKANNLYDKLTGHDAQIVGVDNKKNGADRVVDGIQIQSKYCRTGKACVEECFDSEGNFRYLVDGKPMQIEVPSDKYDVAVEVLKQKIEEGKVAGVSDPNEAKNIIRKGHFTYEQVKNIAKAGTIESITYDAVNGMICASSAFGVTAVITFAVGIWNGEDINSSIRRATISGLKVGGTAFLATVLSSQLAKAGLNSALVGSSETVVAILGPKASAVLVNAFRTSGNIYGAAAMKSAAKLLRGNVITSGVTVLILSATDVTNIFKGRISGQQLFKNVVNTVGTVAGGSGGWLAGAAAGSAICPGVGTVIGGVVGAFVGGTATEKITSTVMDNFIEDDVEEMVRIIQKNFERLSQEYLLTQKEAEKICDNLAEQLTGSVLKDMFASENRTEYARGILLPIIQNEIEKRTRINIPSDEQMINVLKKVLEEIYDTEEYQVTIK